MRPATRRAQPRETGAVVGKEAIVGRRDPGGRLVVVRVVGEPVHPAAAEPPPELPDVGGIEVRAFEDQHDVGDLAPQAGGEPADERAPEDRVPAAAPLLAASHLAAERCGRPPEGPSTAGGAAGGSPPPGDAARRGGGGGHGAPPPPEQPPPHPD